MKAMIQRRTHEAPPNQLQIISMTLQSGEDLIVGNRLRQILVDARKHACLRELHGLTPSDRPHTVAILQAAFAHPFFMPDERKIDPTFLYRDTTTAQEKNSDITTATCHYKPLFGQGDSDTSVVVGVARYGEAVIDSERHVRAGSIPRRRPGVRCSRRERLRQIRK